MKKLLLTLIMCFWAITAQAALSIDNSSSNANSPSGSTMTGTITTSNTNDLVCVISKFTTTSGTVSSVSASPTSLTFTKRAAVASSTGVSGNDYDVEEWCAFSSTALTSTETITVTATGTIGTNRTTIIAVHGVAVGAHPTCYFDPNFSLPATTSQNGDVAPISVSGVSTTNTNDLIIAYTGSVGGSYTNPTGFSQIASGQMGSANDASYEVLSSTLSSATVTYNYTAGSSPGGGQVLLVDVYQDGSSACSGGGTFPAPAHHRGIFG